MTRFAALAPLLFLAALVLGLAVMRRLFPPPPRSPDAPGLRSVARFRHQGSDPASLMDALVVALEAAGFSVSPWRFQREGCVVFAERGPARARLELLLYGEATLLATAIVDELPFFVALPDDETSRALLRAAHATLRAHPRVEALRWLAREHAERGRPPFADRPFADA